jgi:phage terminase large subunit-like protein
MTVKKITSSRCQVCRHDERWRIELLRAGGASLDSLAEKFGVHRDAIFRHWRDHVSDEMKAGYLAGNRNTSGYSPDRADALVWALTSLSQPDPPEFGFA